MIVINEDLFFGSLQLIQIFFQRSYSTNDPLVNVTLMTINKNLPSEDHMENLEKNTMNFFGDLENDFQNLEYIREERLRDLTLAVLSVLAPIYYIYTWVVTRSLFVELGHQSNQVHNLGTGGQGTGAGVRRLPAKLVAVRLVTTNHGHNQVYPHSLQPSPHQSPDLPWYVDTGGHQQQPLPSIYVQSPGSVNTSRF